MHGGARRPASSHHNCPAAKPNRKWGVKEAGGLLYCEQRRYGDSCRRDKPRDSPITYSTTAILRFRHQIGFAVMAAACEDVRQPKLSTPATLIHHIIRRLLFIPPCFAITRWRKKKTSQPSGLTNPTGDDKYLVRCVRTSVGRFFIPRCSTPSVSLHWVANGSKPIETRSLLSPRPICVLRSFDERLIGFANA